MQKREDQQQHKRKLEGSVVVVTGGASGIGRAVAVAFGAGTGAAAHAARPVHVLVADVDAVGAHETCRLVQGALATAALA
jgi:NAD(P)-dependent dehydrogenase (short-subunit alcohol dehydrogenase family)